MRRELAGPRAFTRIRFCQVLGLECSWVIGPANGIPGIVRKGKIRGRQDSR